MLMKTQGQHSASMYAKDKTTKKKASCQSEVLFLCLYFLFPNELPYRPFAAYSSGVGSTDSASAS